MLLFVFMSQKLEYLNCAKTIISRLLCTNPSEKIQIASVSTENVVNTEPETVSPPSIELLDHIDQLIELLLSSTADESTAVDQETKLKFGFKVILQMITNIKDHQHNQERTELERYEKPAPKSRKKIPKKDEPIEVILFTNLQNAKLSENFASNNKMIDEFKIEQIKIYIFSENISYAIPENTIDEHLSNIIKNSSLLPSELTTLQQFIVQTDGFLANINFGASLFESIKNRKFPQTWNVDFRIGTELIIPLYGYRKTIGYEEPKWFNQKRKIEGETSEQNELKQDEEEDEKENLNWKKVFDVHTTNEGEGFLTKEEKTAHKPKTLRCLDLLFTMDKNEVHAIHHEKPVYIFKPNTKSKDSINNINAFTAFAHALVEHNLVGIARKCYNKNTNPKLVVLRPYKIMDDKIVIESFQLPFKDNIVNPLEYIKGTTGLWKIPNKDHQLDPSIVINAEIQDHVNDFLKELTLKEDDYTKILPPQLQFNPKLDYLYQKIIERARQQSKNENKELTEAEEAEWESSLNNLHIRNSQPKFLKLRAAYALDDLIMKL